MRPILRRSSILLPAFRPRAIVCLIACSIMFVFASDPARADAVGQLQIVAHPDDDLYFQNPAVAKGIQSGEPSWTVFLTAGDAGGPPSYWPVREAGILAAYAAMAGVPNDWTLLPQLSLTSYALDAAPQVIVVFMRLPDGNGLGTGNATTGFESLQKLWELPAGELVHSVDGVHQYTRSQLIDKLVAIVNYFGARRLRIQDPSSFNGEDHSDHVHGARFAFEAFQRAFHEPLLRFYRAYNTSGEPINLSDAERTLTAAIQTVYGQFDTGAQPNQWNDREIGLSPVLDARANLAWTGDELGLPPDSCLASVDLGLPTAALIFQTCSDDPAQSFVVKGRSLRQQNQCLTTPATGGAPGSLGFTTCNGSPEQGWTLFTDGHMRHLGNNCLGDNGGVPGMMPCSVGSRVLEIRAQAAYAAGDGTDFSAAEWASDPARSGSLRFGDLNGDERDDVCARRADGLYCALALVDGELGPATSWSSEFEDAGGWGAVDSGSSIQLGDIDGDQLADVCGRASDGIHCALSTGTGFTASSLWSTSFSDADGGLAPESYASLRLGDVDGDGLADLCGVRAGGVHCLASDGLDFDPPSAWIGSAWTTALGLPAAQRGRTMMLGDIDGDGDADLCERGISGVYCAMADPLGAGFVDLAMRSQAEFGDAGGWSVDQAYWGTLRLADVSGDGQADLCGRAAEGLVCLFSVDGRFSAIAHLVTEDFSDADGYLGLHRGPTIGLPDLNGDGRADVCASSATELSCALLADPFPVPEAGVVIGLLVGVTALGGAGGWTGRIRRKTLRGGN